MIELIKTYWNTGTSDPYVKFKLGNKVIYRSKTIYRDLNPIWEEDFDVHLDDLNTPLHIRVMIIIRIYCTTFSKLNNALSHTWIAKGVWLWLGSAGRFFGSSYFWFEPIRTEQVSYL